MCTAVLTAALIAEIPAVINSGFGIAAWLIIVSAIAAEILLLGSIIKLCYRDQLQQQIIAGARRPTEELVAWLHSPLRGLPARNALVSTADLAAALMAEPLLTRHGFGIITALVAVVGGTAGAVLPVSILKLHRRDQLQEQVIVGAKKLQEA